MIRTLTASAGLVVIFIYAVVHADDAGVAADRQAAQNPVGGQLIRMFSAGYTRGPNALADARRRYDAAKDESKGDPRVEYAFGLVLLKQLRNKEAIVQFQSATKQTGTQFWPAWQALIWSHFVAKDYASGYERLKEFARQLAVAKGQVDQTERQRSAEWIGEVIAALQKSVDTVKQRSDLLREDETIKEILGLDLQSSYAGGKSSVNALHGMMEDDVQQAREHETAKQEKERADKQAHVAKEIEASSERRESLKKTTEEWKKYLDEQIAGYDKQLQRFERDYDFLQKRVMSIAASQLLLNTELGLLTQQISNNSGRANSSNLVQAYQQRQAVLEVQLLRYQVDFDQSMASMMMVSQKAQLVVDQRIATVRQYEKATGQLVEQDAAITKWQERLKKDGEKLKTPATAKSKALASKMQQARSFRTYVDLDLTLERDRLLDTFGVAMPDPPPQTVKQ